MTLESDHRKSVRLTKMRAIVLSLIEAGAMTSIALAAPNVLSILYPGAQVVRGEERVHNAVSRLLKQGLIEFRNGRLGMTEKGSRYLEASALQISRPKKWDRKWRVVIFDIPETSRGKRIALRKKLEQIGFYRLQNSVWVFPFDCEGLIILLKKEYHLGKDVLYMIVDTIEMDSRLKAHFSLT